MIESGPDRVPNAQVSAPDYTPFVLPATPLVRSIERSAKRRYPIQSVATGDPRSGRGRLRPAHPASGVFSPLRGRPPGRPAHGVRLGKRIADTSQRAWTPTPRCAGRDVPKPPIDT